MSGFITIERSIWDHPLFKAEPMTEREAWMWMIAQAAWSATRHRVGSELFDVPRGTFMATLREMQAAFMWKSDKRVRTFLKTLEKEGMIGRTTVGAANAPKTHVTICKYEEYQSRGRTKDAPKTHDGTHHGRTTDAVKEQGNNITKEEDTNVSLYDAPPPIDEIAQAVSAYNATAARIGWPSVQKLTPQRRSALKGRIKDAGGVDGWAVALEKAEASRFLRGESGNFRCTFDFLSKQANFTKLMEGNYDDRPSQTRNTERDNTTFDEILAAARAR